MDELKEQVERYLLRRLYPRATDNRLDKLAELLRRKGMSIVEITIDGDSLDNLMCSIIRHRYTQYEQVMASGVSRDNARGLVQPILQAELDKMKGV